MPGLRPRGRRRRRGDRRRRAARLRAGRRLGPRGARGVAAARRVRALRRRRRRRRRRRVRPRPRRAARRPLGDGDVDDPGARGLRALPRPRGEGVLRLRPHALRPRRGPGLWVREQQGGPARLRGRALQVLQHRAAHPRARGDAGRGLRRGRTVFAFCGRRRPARRRARAQRRRVFGHRDLRPAQGAAALPRPPGDRARLERRHFFGRGVEPRAGCLERPALRLGRRQPRPVRDARPPVRPRAGARRRRQRRGRRRRRRRGRRRDEPRARRRRRRARLRRRAVGRPRPRPAGRRQEARRPLRARRRARARRVVRRRLRPRHRRGAVGTVVHVGRHLQRPPRRHWPRRALRAPCDPLRRRRRRRRRGRLAGAVRVGVARVPPQRRRPRRRREPVPARRRARGLLAVARRRRGA